MSKIYKLPLIMEPQPEGGYVVTCPLLPELITEGDTVNEAVFNANDALEAIIEAYLSSRKRFTINDEKGY